MNRIYIRLILVSFFFTVITAARAQVLEKIRKDLHAYQQTFQEKIYVQTDKETYVAGELLWFKVYNVNAADHTLTDLSKVAYVELIDQHNNFLAQTKIELKAGTGEGSLYVPTSVVNGTFRFRAYTNWMKNFGEAQVFEKGITLINTIASPEPKDLPKKESLPTLSFFAEGGDLIEGLPATLAFKASDSEGKGIALNGVIVNQKNDTVARFETLKFGMGKFTFTPQPQYTYKAIAGTSKKEILIQELPAAKKQGYALSLSQTSGKDLSLTVYTNTSDQKVYFFAHNGTKTSMAETGNLINGRVAFSIPPDQLSEGVNLFTVFNETGRPVAERLYFKRPAQHLQLEAKPEFSIYDARKKVSVDLLLNGENAPAELSVSVRRLDSLQGMDHDDIESYLWLSSALRGRIESPSYYFQQADKETDMALDHLLLTQGWRRFSWDKALNRNSSALKFLPEMNGHLVSGELKNENGQPKINTLIYMGIPGKRVQFYSALTDTSGRFAFNTKAFYGLNEIIVQTDTKTDTTSKITIRSPFLEEYGTFDFKALTPGVMPLEELKNYNVSMQVQNVYATSQINRFKPLKIDSGIFYGKPSVRYRLDDYTRFEQMEDVLREFVKEVFISKSQNNYHVKIAGKTDYLNENPLVLLDGVPYFNMNRMMEIDPKKIKSLDVITELYYYGPAVFEGILNFTSYKPNLANIAINPNAVVLDYEGLQTQREFYTPEYETETQRKNRLPDFRNVLFWSGKIPVDAKGEAHFDFYTSDLPGTYIGVINGLSRTGSAGSTTFSFKVKEKL